MRLQLPLLSVVTFAATIMLGCTGEAPQMNSTGFVSLTGNQPPVVRSARIVPDPAVLSAPLTVQVDADDPDRNAVSFKLKWFVNEQLVPGDGVSPLAPDRLKRGNRVQAEVTPFDGTVEGAPYRTQTITIGNTPPVVAGLLLEPAPAIPGDRIRARVEASDADHDMVHLSFRWWKNQNVVMEGEEPELDTTGFERKDQIRVEVTPHDDSSKGQVVSSGTLTLGNSSPKFVSAPGVPSGRDLFAYVVQAKDADGDPVTFLLETAPSGMTIDKLTGLISWKIPVGLMGTHRVRVVAEDGQGGSSFQEFDLTIPVLAAAS